MIRASLERVFNPQSVAVVGDKKAIGYTWLRSLSTFKGRLYSIQIDPQEFPGIEALGVKNYLSLMDIPEPIDFAVLAVPRAVTPRIIADCIRKGVGGASLFTSGFAESGTPEGKETQELLRQLASQANFNLIGPNCMGIYNPRIGLRNVPEQPWGEAGNVDFISQSGTHATMFSLQAPLEGIKINKSVSYGNAIVLDSPDFLEYFAADKETKIIAMYIEGVREGGRLFRLLRQTTPSKPVILWKGGETEEGSSAAASHTASLALSPLLWQAMERQCGAVKVDSLEEMLDSIKALLDLKPVPGKRVGLIAVSGGQSVVIADAFAKAGLKVPHLTTTSYGELASFFNIIGGSYKNPLDVSWNLFPLENLRRMLDILGRDSNLDAIGLELPTIVLAPTWERHPELLDSLLDTLIEFRDRCPKPLLTMLTAGHREAVALAIRDKMREKGIPSFPTFQRGAAALKKAADYYAWKRGGSRSATSPAFSENEEVRN